jgi:hypothetical protein
MSDYGTHLRHRHQRQRLRGVPDLAAALDRPDVSPSVKGALGRMVPMPQRPPTAVNTWDVKKVDGKYRVAVTLGRSVLGWDAGTIVRAVMDGPCLLLIGQDRDDVVAELGRMDVQGRVLLPRRLSDPLRMVPGAQVFVEAERAMGVLRLHPAGLVELAAAVANGTPRRDHDEATA